MYQGYKNRNEPKVNAFNRNEHHLLESGKAKLV